MSGQLPALPEAGVAISADDVQRWESQVAEVVTQEEDMGRLGEWLKQAAALETYMRGKEMQSPMMGAQRRIEARIGQLLGSAETQKGGRGKTAHHAEGFHTADRNAFRHLAKALNGECKLTAEEWRKSRRAHLPRALRIFRWLGYTGAMMKSAARLTI